MKKLFSILLIGVISAIATLGLQAAGGTWKLHHTSDGRIFQLVDTPSRTYVLGYAQEYSSGVKDCTRPYFYVIYYDKGSDEFMYPTAQEELSETLGSVAAYNPDKKYLMVVYHNYNIDLIYDDGKVVNIPGYMLANVVGDKQVNDITFNASENAIYMATNFGYVKLDDSRGEISTSRNYQTAISSVARLGDKLMLLIGSDIFWAPRDDSNYNLSDFVKAANLPGAKKLTWLNDNTVIAGCASSKKDVYFNFRLSIENNELKSESIGEYCVFLNPVPNKSGYLFIGAEHIKHIGKDGKETKIDIAEEDRGLRLAAWDNVKFTFSDERRGIYTRSYSSDSKEWSTPGQRMIPDASSAFRCTDMQYHPKWGMLVVNHGYSYHFNAENTSDALIGLSGYRNGSWTRLGWPYTNPEFANVMQNPDGLAVDPNDNKYVYFGSILDGLVRLNMDDPNDVMQIAQSSHPMASHSGFVAAEKVNAAWARACRFSAPSFDNEGRMWVLFNDMDDKTNINVRCWSAADRLASSPGNYHPMKNIQVKFDRPSNQQIVYALKHSTNRNLILIASNIHGTSIMVLDHNGTPDDTSDDRAVVMGDIYNQDGGQVSKSRINNFFEDPATGLVWVATTTGLFYFNPQQAFANPSLVTVPKVNRNDGSGFADYLLSGVDVMKISQDGAGRKWFATFGAGLVCTSSDARTIISEYTTENSWIPSDDVIGVEYNPDNGSMMVATMNGLASLLPAGSATAADDMSMVRAYPNPVRPDYYGWVTIDGLTDNAVVKIVDAAGNLVKELGFASGGETQWDTTNFNHQRVNTGVYYVVASSGPGDTSLAKVAKIMVVK